VLVTDEDGICRADLCWPVAHLNPMQPRASLLCLAPPA
jgi:hypothetical protein